MIGGVYTDPAHRNLGYASALIQYIKSIFTENRTDASILWTTTPSFYKKLGWNSFDIGLIASIKQHVLLESDIAAVKFERLSAKEINQFERLRKKYLPYRLIRNPIDYETIPIPATKLEFFAVIDEELKAFAATGRNGRSVYAYEVIGDPDYFGVLFSTFTKNCNFLFLNDYSNSASANWLERMRLVNWESKNLAMWQVHSSKLLDIEIKDIYIPLIDRI